MAKGKSNPKTVERVKGLTKAMRGELELAEAEAAAKEMEMGGKFAKDKKKGRGKRDAISSDDDDDEVTNNTVNTNSTGKPTPKAKVQIGGFGIGCRGTGNEKAKQLKLEHDEKTKAKKAARVAAATKKESARVNAHTTHDSDDDESWRVRNPTHNKKANRKKKGVGKNQTESYASDDDVADIETLATRMEMEDENELVEGEETREGGNALNPNPKGGSTTVSAFSLLRGDEEEKETETEIGVAKAVADDDDDWSDSGDDLLNNDELRVDDTLDAAFAGLSVGTTETENVCGGDGGDFEGRVEAVVEDSDSYESRSETESDWETDEELDANAQPNPLLSLFCTHASETVETNLEYMRRAHGLVVPYEQSLHDKTGFVNYLRRKVVRRKQCLFCAKRFQTVEGVRGHMRDKKHVRLVFEPPAVFRGNPLFDEAIRLANEDGYQPEYAEFYDFGGYENGLTDGNAGSALFDAARVGGGLELVLRDKNGRTKQLGHRSFRQYYRQKFRNDYVAKGSKSDEKRVAANAPAVKLARREETKKTHAIITRSMRVALRGASKALAAQYTTKAQFADNAARRAVVHHWGAGGGGSHYYNSGSKQFLKGVRIKGVISRHSKQGAKMQAVRVQASRNKQNRGNASVAVLRSSTRKG